MQASRSPRARGQPAESVHPDARGLRRLARSDRGVTAVLSTTTPRGSSSRCSHRSGCSRCIRATASASGGPARRVRRARPGGRVVQRRPGSRRRGAPSVLVPVARRTAIADRQARTAGRRCSPSSARTATRPVRRTCAASTPSRGRAPRRPRDRRLLLGPRRPVNTDAIERPSISATRSRSIRSAGWRPPRTGTAADPRAADAVLDPGRARRARRRGGRRLVEPRDGGRARVLAAGIPVPGSRLSWCRNGGFVP